MTLLTRTQQDYMRAAVHNGAIVLDEKYPKWYRKIDLNTLDLGAYKDCICGQLAYSYYKAAALNSDPFRTFGLKLLGRLSKARRNRLGCWKLAADRLGFDIPTRERGLDYLKVPSAYRFLDKQWTRQIERRLREETQ